MKVIKQSAHIVTDWPKMNLYERCEFAGRISHASEDKIKEGSAEEFVRRMVKLGHESVFEFARVVVILNGKTFPVNLRKLREIAKAPLYDTDIFFDVINDVSEHYPVFFEGIPLKHTKEKSHVWVVEGSANYDHKEDWISVLITTNRAISHQLVRYRKNVVYLQASQRYIKYKDELKFIDPSVYFGTDNEGDGYQMYRQWIESMQRAEQDYIHCLSEGYSAQAARLFLPNSAATKLIMYASPNTWRHVFEQRISDKADPMIRELLEPLKEEFVKEGLL